jgi:hypothetical protein
MKDKKIDSQHDKPDAGLRRVMSDNCPFCGAERLVY